MSISPSRRARESRYNLAVLLHDFTQSANTMLGVITPVMQTQRVHTLFILTNVFNIFFLSSNTLDIN